MSEYSEASSGFMCEPSSSSLIRSNDDLTDARWNTSAPVGRSDILRLWVLLMLLVLSPGSSSAAGMAHSGSTMPLPATAPPPPPPPPEEEAVEAPEPELGGALIFTLRLLVRRSRMGRAFMVII